MVRIALRPGIIPTQAQAALGKALAEWEERHWDAYLRVTGEMFRGEITVERAGEKVIDLLEETEDELREVLPEVLDRFWDFSRAPGGTVGFILESVDDDFWAGVLFIGRHAMEWVAKGLTRDDLEKAAAVRRLSDRAHTLEARARLSAANGNDGLAGRQRAAAARKLERAARITARK